MTDTLHPLLERARALGKRGLLLRQVQVAYAYTIDEDGILHAAGMPHCPQFQGRHTRLGRTSLFSFIEGTDGTPCNDCLDAERFRDAHSDRFLPFVLDRFELLLGLLDLIEKGDRPFRIAKEDESALIDLAYDSAGALSARLKRRVEDVRYTFDERRRGLDGVLYAAEVCALMLHPDPEASSWESAPVNERLTELAAEQRATVLACPNWVVAKMSYVDRYATGVSNSLQRADYVTLFTRGQLLVVPSVVFTALVEVSRPESFVVLPERPSDALVETVNGLYEPEGRGPYAHLPTALAAAQALV